MLFKKKKTIFIFLVCLLLVKNVSSNILMFENFNKKNSNKWEFISDQVMGGISFGKNVFLSENNIDFMRMSGYVSLENNGGFIQVRRKIEKTNISKLNGFKLKIRGNNSDYYLHLRTKFTILPWQYYQAKIKVNSEWTKTSVDLENFYRSGKLLPKKIKPSHIKSIAIVAFGREHKVQVDLDEIFLY